LSIALTVHIDDIVTHHDGQSIGIPLQLAPENISAIRVFNNSPLCFLVSNAPGITQAWLAPFTEEVYTSDPTVSSAFNKTNLGTFSLTPQNLQYRGTDMFFSNAQSFPFQHAILITVYELGDAVPPLGPTPHNQMSTISGEVQTQSMTIIANSQFAAGAAGDILLNAQDAVNQLDTVIVQYFTVMAGFSIDFSTSAAQHNITLTVGGCLPAGANMNFNMNIPAASPYSFSKFPIYYRSFEQGSAVNIITLSIPATSGVPAYSMTAWGYGARLP
jgi:hypothetical protein